jgi:hypothetical protein
MAARAAARSAAGGAATAARSANVRRPLDRVQRELARAFELPARRHAERGVERHDCDAGRRAGGFVEQERARKRHREQHHRGDSQGEQNELGEMVPPRVLHGRAQQQPDGRELQPRLRLALHQVQHDGNRRGEGAQEKQRSQKCHSIRVRVDR